MIATRSSQETVRLGERIGRALKANDVLALCGDLGAGKTTLIQGIAKGLGIKDYVTSPTFTLINEFKGRLNFYHIDLYRLEDACEAEDIAIEEYFTKGGVTAIEWADKIKEIMPADSIKIEMQIKGDNERDIKIEGLKL